jgi:hypothetical protein
MELHSDSLSAPVDASGAPVARRLAARIKRFALDRELAAGADPQGSGLLACRAEQLRSAPTRRHLAADLRDLVKQADHPAGLSAAAPIGRGVRAVRSRLLILAARVEADPDVRPRGMAMLKLMLADGASPIYVPSSVDDLEGELDAATEALG